MKNQKKAKSIQTNKKVIVTCKTVGMEKKQGVILIRSDIDKMTEDEIRDLLKKISAENKELRKIYYAQNTPVMQIRRRKFSDLLKKFVDSLKEENNLQMIGASVQYKEN